MSISTPGKHSRLWKEWRRAGKGKGTAFFMEHRAAVLESLESAHPPSQVLLGETLFRSQPERWEKLARDSKSTWFLVAEDDLNRLLSVKTSSGLCGLYEPREFSLNRLLHSSFILVAWQIQDPGNLGTALRSCAGLTGGALLSVGGCNPWSSKVARASAGALFRTPVLQISPQQGETALRTMEEAGFIIYAAVPRGGEAPVRVRWTERDAVVIGNESHGMPELPLKSVVNLTIPMTSQTESLNAGVAASLLMYERQRML